MANHFDSYLSKIDMDLRGGKATEYTYRTALENYMESLGRGIKASSDPKHIDCGAPDFVIEKRRVPLGYVETKDVDVDLDRVEKSEQMQRYLKALNNLILTDYLEFRWYVNGQRVRKLRVAERGRSGRLAAAPQAGEILEQLFHDFFTTEAPTVSSPKELASRLAGITHFIRDQIISVLTSGDESLQNALNTRYRAFCELLLPNLKPEEFGDLYAQTMTYGLFAAKLSAPEGADFTLEGAYQFLFGSRFLRRLFSDVSEELDEIEILHPYLQDIVSLLNRADFHSILADFGRRTRTEDPVVHFYETFLAAYDPKLRESRGVYYTPEPVVQFIVRAVDELLKTRFGKPWGLADSSVKILDPATGTGTFLYFVIQQIHEEIALNRQQAGMWPQKSKELLERIFGFELLIAPYVVAHLKLGLQLNSLGAPLSGRGDERLQVYLTNTLEEGITRAEQLAGLGHYIAEEASDAAHVKKLTDIMVVLCNPPYSGHSANASKDRQGNLNFIGRLLRDYYFVDGAPLGERNPKWLQDDYVKFIRFGEWRIHKTGHGILAFITNHGYLDNPTFRGMRQHLMQTFDEIYVLDLHGNSKKKEKPPQGGKDENVFDIQQGVAVLLSVKNPGARAGGAAVVRHAELWGEREGKYTTLLESGMAQMDWQELKPVKPYYLFVPQDIRVAEEYKQFWKLTDVFPINSVGIVTARDSLTTHMEKDELWRVINDFVSLSEENARIKYELGNDTRDWKISLAQKDLGSTVLDREKIKPILYRPFDLRFTYYSGQSRGFICMPRPEVMSHMMSTSNIGLISARSNKSNDMNHFFVSQTITEAKCGESTTQSYLFPLYKVVSLFNGKQVTCEPNFSQDFIKEIRRKLGMEFVFIGRGEGQQTFGPEDVFNYAYAVFHSPAYRARYAEFLKIDFPRLPLTADKDLFFRLAELGGQLVSLHLLRATRVQEFITTYPVAGSNRVEKPRFQPDPQGESGRVWINEQQYFGGVPQEVWEFKVGGYQVCEKWLKDRKERVLTGEDLAHYQRVVVALKETIRLMEEIDETIPDWPLE